MTEPTPRLRLLKPWSELTRSQQDAYLEHEMMRDNIEDTTGIRPDYVVTETPGFDDVRARRAAAGLPPVEQDSEGS